MSNIFTWKTISEEHIELNYSYTYNEINHSQDLTGWTSKYFDLTIHADVSLDNNVVITDYLNSNEDAYWLIAWRGDDKFSGCSEPVLFKEKEIQSIKFQIPKGSFDNFFTLQIHLISKAKKDTPKKRLDGSLIATKLIYDNNRMASDKFFPLKEFRGKGENLFFWEFINEDDLEIAVIYSILLKIDLNHPFLIDFHINKEIRNLLFVMIITSFFQKAITEEIVSQIINRGSKPWPKGSLGGAYKHILYTVLEHNKLKNIETLKQEYYNNPVNILKSISNLYTVSLKHAQL